MSHVSVKTGGDDKLTVLRLRGQVFTGKGEGSEFTSLPWAMRQIEDRLGLKLFPGTLNVRLTDDDLETREMLRDEAGFEILQPAEYCSARLYRARLGGIDCGLIIPNVADYPRNVIELVSSINLRQKLCLSDGSQVEVKVTL